MSGIEIRSIAKVNLGLHIMGKLANGYHLLETLFYPVEDLFDDVLIRRIDELECRVLMPGFGESVPLERNLAWRAWKVLRDHYPDRVGGVEIEIRKRIPAGAGLGGGSSNAGAVFKGLNTLMELGLGEEELAGLAEPLGADVPFFIYGKPLYATGIGNRFEVLPLDLSAYRLEVRTLPVHSGTAEAYGGLDLESIRHDLPLKELLVLPLPAWKEKVLNDLEPGVVGRFPQIGEAVNELYSEGAKYAAMTGSGSAVFALF